MTEEELLKKNDKKWIPEGSVFRKKLDPLVQQQSEMYSKLDTNKAADWTVEEIVAPLKAELNKLEIKLPSERAAEEEAARGYLLKKIDQVYRDAAQISGKRIDEFVETVKIPKFSKAGDVVSTQSVKIPTITEASKEVIMNRLKDANIDVKGLDIVDGKLMKANVDLASGTRTVNELSDEALEAMLSQSGKKKSDIFKGIKGADASYTAKNVTEGGYERAGEETINLVRRADKAGLDKVKIPYSRGRNILDSMQDDAYDREVAGSSFLKKAISTGTKGAGLGAMADLKAASAGSAVGDVNKQIYKLRNTFKTASEALSPNNIGKAMFGAGADNNPAYANVRQALKMTDAELGTDLSSEVGMQSMRAWAENAYMNPKAFGSGRVKPAMAEGFAKGAMQGAGGGALLGAPMGMSAPFAIAGGLAQGTRKAIEAGRLASPEQALRSLNNIQSQEAAASALINKLPGGAGQSIRDLVSMPQQSLEQIYSMPLREQLERQAKPIQVVNPLNMQPKQIPTQQFIDDEDDEDWSN
jgi:hypothetical protein